MRLLDRINLNRLRVFEAVYTSGNMTEAARELGMTQSAISQHVKALETDLQVRLFDRLPAGLHPTAAATTLYLKCTQGFALLEGSLLEITGKARDLEGSVSVGTPPEFGEAVLLPRLARFLAQHRRVRVKLEIAASRELNEAVLSGDLAFAFVDGFAVDRRLKRLRVFEETLDLCMSQELLKLHPRPANRREYYESLDYVEYAEGEALLRMWFQHHLGKRHLAVDVRCYGETCRSVAQLIERGVGAGVLPGEQIAAMEAYGRRFHRFEGCRRPLINPINLAFPGAEALSLPAKALMNWLVDNLAQQTTDHGKAP